MRVSVIQGVRTDELIVKIACLHATNLFYMTGVSLNEYKIYSRSLCLVKINSSIFIGGKCFKPLNPKSDQHQISPCNINAL